ncbi:MAG: hypothetical protein IKB51_02410 [Clostridia bacterium]|nr:hypothetical protein [Clostridia bacterium]
MQKNISLKKALMYAFAFSVLLFWELFLCLVKNKEFFDIFVSAALPIYMAAVVLILYPIFRYVNSAFWFFPLFILGACVIIGLPTFILVGLKCESFGIGTGLAYIIYGYILAVVLISLCVFDVLITALVRIVKSAKHREN